jgi:hypothetical protein
MMVGDDVMGVSPMWWLVRSGVEELDAQLS